ncbi:FKBP-type peptidyl-prolyl cis-trans isomerase [Alteromonas sediminis]|uniref:Peptidyl-prolyl cis-trans isomerase n=1 Tax=Alteromonas sediminis TaxID=2259342 RepID=A0A3N5YBZ2_9ALTE|nr:FKBP-type peptidyl-prolyl cis-trans isomerase [Alteromonas sediminis]RPJ66675.1 FKBP-type peptidyl-prolyl cis-trans isomerase [Alteromonas sediminis]
MRKSLIAASTVVALGLMGCQQESANTESVEEATSAALDVQTMTEEQKQAYAMGASMGVFFNQRSQQVAELGGALDKELVLQGFTDSLANNAVLSDVEVQQLTQAAQQQFATLQQAAAAKAAEANIKAGEAFLAENANKEGVVTTESGLQYEVLQAGEGVSPEATDTVKVHYHGTLIDGTVFDSSVDRGEPAEFPLNRVISGWTEGVQLMQEGAKYRFYIPANLAYGQRATGAITPNSTLIFDVELLEVVKPASDAPSE